MSHIVIHDDANGITQYRQFDEAQHAAAYLERLANEDGVRDARLFALQEVEFSVHSYVKVEIGAAPAPAEPVAFEAETVPFDAEPETIETEGEAEVVAFPEPAPVSRWGAREEQVEYVEVSAVDVDPPSAPELAPEPPDAPTSEPRRGLFGR